MSKNCLYLLEIILVNDEEVGRVLNYTEETERVVCCVYRIVKVISAVLFFASPRLHHLIQGSEAAPGP